MKNLVLLLALFFFYSQISFDVTSLDVKCNSSPMLVVPPKDRFKLTTIIVCSSNVVITLTEIDHRDLGYKSTEVTITCNKSQTDLSVLTGLNITASLYSLVEIKGCSLPDSSVSDLLGSIGVRDFDTLHITSYSGSLQRKHFENLDKVQYLTLAQSNFGVLPIDTFKGLTGLWALKIMFSSFKLTKGIFQYSPFISYIYLDRNSISEVSFDVFNDTKILHHLEIIGANNTSIVFDESKQYIAPTFYDFILNSVIIKTIPLVVDSAHNRSKLSSGENIAAYLPTKVREILGNTWQVKLTLAKDTTTNLLLQPGCFSDLYALQEIDLSANNIKFVPEDTFSKSRSITILVLSDNLINTFEENTFSDLEILNTLDLSINKISYLPERLFSRTNSLFDLNLSRNLLQHIEP